MRKVALSPCIREKKSGFFIRCVFILQKFLMLSKQLLVSRNYNSHVITLNENTFKIRYFLRNNIVCKGTNSNYINNLSGVEKKMKDRYNILNT